MALTHGILTPNRPVEALRPGTLQRSYCATNTCHWGDLNRETENRPSCLPNSRRMPNHRATQASRLSVSFHRLVGLVVKASASGEEDPGFESRLRRDFSGSSLTSDLKIGTPVATLPDAWYCRVSAGTGRPGVSKL